MQTKHINCFASLTLLIIGCLDAGTGLAQSPDRSSAATDNDLVQTATWNPPNRHEAEQTFSAWLNSTNASVDSIKRAKARFAGRADGQPPEQMIDVIFDCIVIVRPDLNELRESFNEQATERVADLFEKWLDDSIEHEFLKNHVQLYLGRWLAQNDLFDESLRLLEGINIKQVLDPMTLLFYRGLMEHQLVRKDECLKTIKQLLEHSDSLPRRYEALSRLMLADIQPLEPDSLDEISRMMGDIGRRTGLYRSGKLVLGQEEQVIKKLDKLIEKLEAQQQQSQSTSGQSPPSNPMQESMQASNKGSGQVTSKQIKEGGSWGDLPPAERAAALAEMAKDMPPHYREVIEEYFRRLAGEDDR